MVFLLSARSWSRVAMRPVGKLRERAAEIAFQTSDVGAVADALEPLQHHRYILVVLPDLFDWRLRECNRPTRRLGLVDLHIQVVRPSLDAPLKKERPFPPITRNRTGE
jgi:hypothetical protein